MALEFRLLGSSGVSVCLLVFLPVELEMYVFSNIELNCCSGVQSTGAGDGMFEADNPFGLLLELGVMGDPGSR